MGTQTILFCKFTRKADKGLKVFLAGGPGLMNWGWAELRRATAGRAGGKVVSKLEA